MPKEAQMQLKVLLELSKDQSHKWHATVEQPGRANLCVLRTTLILWNMNWTFRTEWQKTHSPNDFKRLFHPTRVSPDTDSLSFWTGKLGITFQSPTPFVFHWLITEFHQFNLLLWTFLDYIPSFLFAPLPPLSRTLTLTLAPIFFKSEKQVNRK